MHYTTQQLIDNYSTSFMKPVIYHGRFFEVETNHGTEYIDQYLIGKTARPSKKQLSEYIDGSEIYEYKLIDGYNAYLSAPGYMDKTENCVFETEQEAIDYLMEQI